MDAVPYAFCDAVLGCFRVIYRSKLDSKFGALCSKKNVRWVAAAADHLKNQRILKLYVYLTPQGMFYRIAAESGGQCTFKKLVQVDMKYVRIAEVKVLDGFHNKVTRCVSVDKRSLEKILRYIRPAICLAELDLSVQPTVHRDVFSTLLSLLEGYSYVKITMAADSEPAINFLKKHTEESDTLKKVHLAFDCSEELIAVLRAFISKRPGNSAKARQGGVEISFAKRSSPERQNGPKLS
uniref:Tudor domain-containing protein n=1 Tax=Steinernema glaseri TaxID=37863 RepID=A0A1I7YIG1_9BILA